ncbi:arylsulfatase [Mariniphaga anaerophila]|uniref:Arylsulfatase n=1 Tax=Mariniphaga anaerophila TaxID=1484053 RepID=A0A1M5FJI2_9BACT|nr:arylsulfatase [Mariniphaga anaerophila]SHF91579.1 arylsulfatase [Mariniphaga anaerophila]
MKRVIYLNLLVLIILLTACTSRTKIEKPNIIVILVDDMGYSDLGCTGSEIETPNLDKMASEGVLFTNFYNASRCCPTRASILTGQYQWDAGMGHMDYTRSTIPEYQGYLNKQSVTIAEVLKDNGYQTFMSGKWHVGHEQRDWWPDRRGFEQFYGTPAGGGIYFYPSKFYDRPVFWNGEQQHPDSTWYSTDAFTDYSIDYIKNRREKDKPFFMYLAYIAPHFPLQAKKEDIEKYRETYKVGYDVIRKARFEKQKKMGIVHDDLPASEPVYPDWDSVENKDVEAMEMAVYAAMVDCLDQNIGKLFNSLKEESIDENTVVMFLSDNGACQTAWNKTPDAELGSRNCNAGYGIWYNVSNTPYRMRKSQEHEGGNITPLIMRWPAGLDKKGEYIREHAHITDIMPACLELAGADYPKTYNGQELDKPDGKSFLPLLSGQEQDDSRAFFWEHEGNTAVRVGDWKLVSLHKKDWELYNLADDPYELNDLVAQYPDKAEKLLGKYQDWANKHGVQAWPLKKKK